MKLRLKQFHVKYKRVERLYLEVPLQVRQRRQKKVVLGAHQLLLCSEAEGEV